MPFVIVDFRRFDAVQIKVISDIWYKMSRDHFIHMLQEYLPDSSEEQIYKERFLLFVNQYENCFDRTLAVGHITASAWLLNPDRTKVLLMHHAKLDQWVQLGGHCDGNPQVLDVAIKEAQEESGIQDIFPVSEKIFDLDIHLIPTSKHGIQHEHYDVRFLLACATSETFVQNHESKELRWVGMDRSELPTRHSSILRMHDKWLRSC